MSGVLCHCFFLSFSMPTSLCLGSGALAALDLTFCSLGLAVHLDRSVLPDLHSGDHYPVNSHMSMPSSAVSCSEWASFSPSFRFEDRGFPYVDSKVEYFTSVALGVASQYFPFAVHIQSCTCPVAQGGIFGTRFAPGIEFSWFRAHPTLDSLMSFKRLRTMVR